MTPTTLRSAVTGRRIQHERSTHEGQSAQFTVAHASRRRPRAAGSWPD